MRGGCLLEVVAHGGSTVYFLINEFMIMSIFVFVVVTVVVIVIVLMGLFNTPSNSSQPDGVDLIKKSSKPIGPCPPK